MHPVRAVCTACQTVWLAAVEYALASKAGVRFVQFLCGHTPAGHSFRVEVIGVDDGFFTLDPDADCKRCGAKMTEEQYNTVARTYIAFRIQHPEPDEDEVW